MKYEHTVNSGIEFNWGLGIIEDFSLGGVRWYLKGVRALGRGVGRL